MRAREFIVEHSKVGKISKRLRYATRGLHKFRDMEFADRIYELNRVMMAVASNDGKQFSYPMDAESWAGRNDIAAPYTKQEQDMMRMAYKAIGSHHEDLNQGDMDSEEHPAVNTISPIQAFGGYQ
jgi:hypothetical protein